MISGSEREWSIGLPGQVVGHTSSKRFHLGISTSRVLKYGSVLGPVYVFCHITVTTYRHLDGDLGTGGAIVKVDNRKSDRGRGWLKNPRGNLVWNLVPFVAMRQVSRAEQSHQESRSFIVNSSYTPRVVGRNGSSNSIQHLTVALTLDPNGRHHIRLARIEPGNVGLAANSRQ